MRITHLYLCALVFAFTDVRAQNNKLIYNAKEYSVYNNEVVQGPYTAIALSPTEMRSNYQSVYKNIENRNKIAPAWKLSENLSQFPKYTSPYVLSDAIYNMSLQECLKAVEPDSTFRTGKEWSGVWTRDISYSIILSMAILQPKVAMYSLMRKVKNGRVIQDTGTGGAYPVSSDRMIWAVAAWEIYKVTGDKNWLEKVYPIIKKSVADDALNVYDTETGLVRGESSFLDWREETYPRWMEPADIYESECLGTSVVHYQVNKVLAQMAAVLKDRGVSLKYSQTADRIKQGINRRLWMADKGYYGQYLYGRNYKSLSPRSEALGEALAVLFDVTDAAQRASVIKNTPVNEFGIPCIYPQIPNIPPYHNNAVWPFVETYWALAATKAGNEHAVMQAISGIYRPAALFLTNKENFVADNGDYAGTQINSSNMLWSLSGNIALVYKVLFGIHYNDSNLTFEPFVPKALAGVRSLENFKYRNANLDITVKGFGNKIRSFFVDGKATTNYDIPSGMYGDHKIVIVLNNQVLLSKSNLLPDYTTPETPIATCNKGTLIWSKAEGAMSYKILQNGKPIGTTTKTSYKVNNVAFAVYQVISIDRKGVASFASEPVQNIPRGMEQKFEAEKFAAKANNNYTGFSGDGFVNITTTENKQLNITVNALNAGLYTLDYKYANGNGPINTENKCAIRTLTVNGKFAGTMVFPQRGVAKWNDWGFSNPVKVFLQKGVNNVSLQYKPANENMYGDVNQAEIDYLRVIKL